MEENTYHNPGCYHSMISYLSEISGISAKKDIEVNSVWNTMKSGKKKLKFKSWNITVVDKDGNKYAYMQAGNKRFDQCGIIADKFIVSVTRNMNEFGIEVKSAGSYKDSLGGGWHQMVQRYQINDKYFAMMDCAHGSDD